LSFFPSLFPSLGENILYSKQGGQDKEDQSNSSVSWRQRLFALVCCCVISFGLLRRKSLCIVCLWVLNKCIVFLTSKILENLEFLKCCICCFYCFRLWRLRPTRTRLSMSNTKEKGLSDKCFPIFKSRTAIQRLSVQPWVRNFFSKLVKFAKKYLGVEFYLRVVITRKYFVYLFRTQGLEVEYVSN